MADKKKPFRIPRPRRYREPPPEKKAREDAREGVKDGYCPRCKEWYDTNNKKDFKKHSH